MTEQEKLWHKSTEVVALLSDLLVQRDVSIEVGVLALMRMAAGFAGRSLGMPPQVFMATMGQFYSQAVGCDMTVVVSGGPIPLEKDDKSLN